jgi:hypothetical protein
MQNKENTGVFAAKLGKKSSSIINMSRSSSSSSAAQTKAIPEAWTDNKLCGQMDAAIVPGNYRVGSGARLLLVQGAVKCNDELFAEAWDYGMDEVKAVPNPMNRKFMIRRRQCTFGAEYSFGRQKSVNHGPISHAPTLIKKCTAHAKKLAPRFGVDPLLLTGAHVNWYPDGKAGLGSHQDTETESTKGCPIFSYSFLFNSSATGFQFRCFRVTRAKNDGKDSTEVVANLPLRNGDLAVMYGKKFQRDFWHSVPNSASKRYATLRRINVTIRVWGGESHVSDKRQTKKKRKRTDQRGSGGGGGKK